jgi:hypothetical protein
MALIDRIAPNAEGGIEIPAHEICAALFFWAIGTITRANVITVMGLFPSDEAQLDALAAAYTALATKADKQEFLRKIEAGAILLQSGKITKAQYLSLLGF